MVFRKIIGFGGTSFIISLPKKWVDKNGLKKGDTINIEEEGDSIRVEPISTKQSSNKKNITLDFDGDLKKLKSELIHAYIDDYNIININGKNLFNNLDDIKDILDGLLALEIIQKAPDKVVLKDFLNINDISVHDTIRRVDRIILSMIEDVKNYLNGTNLNVDDSIKHKENDVNRLTNLLFKTLKKCFNSNDRKLLKLELEDIFYYWEMILFMEKIADQLKLIHKHILPNVSNECLAILDTAIIQYTDSMKSNFSKDYSLAINVIVRKKGIYESAEEIVKNLPHGKGYGFVLERIKNINDYSGNIAKSLLRLKLELKKDQ